MWCFRHENLMTVIHSDQATTYKTKYSQNSSHLYRLMLIKITCNCIIKNFIQLLVRETENITGLNIPGCFLLFFFFLFSFSASLWASLIAQPLKNPPAMWENLVWTLGWKDPLDKGMITNPFRVAPWPFPFCFIIISRWLPCFCSWQQERKKIQSKGWKGAYPNCRLPWKNFS